MGCCSSTPLNTVLLYNGQTKRVPNVTSLSIIRNRIGEFFEELKGVPIEMVDSSGKNLMQEEYEKSLKDTREVTVTVRRIQSHTFQDPYWNALLDAVFCVAAEGRCCISSAFLITDRIAITSSDAVKQVELKALKAHFEKPAVFDTPLDDSFYVALPGGLALIRLSTAPASPHPIQLSSISTAANDQLVTLIYVIPTQYSRQRPVINVIEDQKIVENKGDASRFSKSMPRGVEGAPVLSGTRELVGVYLGGKDLVVANAPAITASLRVEAAKLSPEQREALHPILNSLPAEPQPVTYPPPAVPPPLPPVPDTVVQTLSFGTKPQQEEEPDEDPEIVVDLPSAPHARQPVQASSSNQSGGQLEFGFEEPQVRPQELSRFAYSVDLQRHRITLLDKDCRPTATVNHDNRFLSGISCVLMPEGLLITGPDPNSNYNAALCLPTEVRDLTSTIYEHRYHCSVYFHSAAVVISGLMSASVEKLSSPQGSWESVGTLPEKRAYASAVVFGNNIYVVGGIPAQNQDATTTIFQGDGARWTRVEVSLLSPISGAAVIVAGNSLVLFGGNRGTVASEEVWELNPESGSIAKTMEFRTTGSLHAYQPAYFENDVMVASESGAVYRYSLDKKKLSEVLGPTSGSA